MRVLFNRALIVLSMPLVLLAAVSAGTEDDKLTASDGAAGDKFGRSISLSGDRILVGAYGDDDNGSFSGSAYVFVQSGAGWTQEDKLKPNDGAGTDLFGNAVALSGQTAVIGSPLDDDNGNLSGSAYVFIRSGSQWIQQDKLIANDGSSGDSLGNTVSVDGDTALVSAHEDDDAGFGSGSAYVFVRNGTNWTQQAKLTASDAAAADTFGYSVSVSGNTAAVGAYANDDSGINSGSVYIFVRNGSNWTQQAKLNASDGAANDFFGNSVSIKGNTVLVGAPDNDDNGSASGSAYVFVRTGSTWTQQAKLNADDGAANDTLGYSVSIDDSVAVVGAHGDDDNGDVSGSAYVFVRQGGSWTQQSKLTTSDGATGDQFGFSVSVSGALTAASAPGNDDSGTDSGSAYVYELDISNSTGTSFCSGDGSGLPCPCGAVGESGQGCPNTNPNGNGARLLGIGNAQFSDDSLQLIVTDGPFFKPGIVFQGGAAVNFPNGINDVPNASGILCVDPNLRGSVFFTNAEGDAEVSHFQGKPFGLSAQAAGSTTYYQYWYRDQGNTCQNAPGNTASFNFSNGFSIVWAP